MLNIYIYTIYIHIWRPWEPPSATSWSQVHCRADRDWGTSKTVDHQGIRMGGIWLVNAATSRNMELRLFWESVVFYPKTCLIVLKTRDGHSPLIGLNVPCYGFLSIIVVYILCLYIYTYIYIHMYNHSYIYIHSNPKQKQIESSHCSVFLGFTMCIY